MGTYIVRRLIQFVFILFGLSIVFFLILHLTPGGPCAALESGGAKGQALYHICVQRYGLDRPLVVQYALWIGGYLHGDFGQTLGGISVASEFQEFLPVTILLATVSYALQLLIAIPLGIFSALKQYSFFDSVFTFISYVGLSTPTFWLGLFCCTFSLSTGRYCRPGESTVRHCPCSGHLGGSMRSGRIRGMCSATWHSILSYPRLP